MKFNSTILALSIAVFVTPKLSLAASNQQASPSMEAAQSAIWKRLGAASWVRDGKKDAPRIVYVITDPNCVWCHRFWEASRPWVDAGKVQVRHLLVGFIKPNSAGKAAAILSASDRTAALTLHELSATRGGIAEAPSVSEVARTVLADNFHLMREFGFSGTPAIIYKDSRDKLAAVAGFPGERMEVVMGSTAPRR